MPISQDEFSYTLELEEELKSVPRNKRRQVKQDIGKMILKEIERDTRQSRSPVDGESFEPLSPEYRAFKRKKGKGTKADLHLENKMIPSIKNRNTRDGIKFEITKKKEIPKAFNHNTGDTLPQRQFMPDEELNEEFSPRIMSKVDKIIAENKGTPRRRTVSEDIERELIDRLGKRGAQSILRQGLDVDNLVDEILDD